METVFRNPGLVGVNPLKFDKKFYTFSTILEEPNSMWVLTRGIVYFSYLQMLIVSFFPLIHLESETNSLLSYLYRTCLSFSGSFQLKSSQTIVISLFFMMILFYLCTYFLNYFILKGFEVPKWILRMRGLLFLYVPSFYLYPFSIHLGFSIKMFGNNPNQNIQVSFIAIVSLLSIVINTVFFQSIEPLISSSPFCSSDHIPSRLIPDSNFYFFQLKLNILFISGIVLEDSVSVVFFNILISLNDYFQIRSVLSFPYLYDSDSILSLAIYATQITIQVLILISKIISPISHDFLLVSSVIILVVFFFFFDFVFYIKKNYLFQKLISSTLSPTEFDTSFFTIVQVLIMKNIIKSGVDQLSNIAFNSIGDYKKILIAIYLQLIEGNSIDFENIEKNIYSLSMVTSASFNESFFLYQITRQECLTKKLFSEEKYQSLFEGLLKNYHNSMMSYWEYSVKGKLFDALRCINQLEVEATSIKRIINILSTFYYSSPEFQSFIIDLKTHNNSKYLISIQGIVKDLPKTRSIVDMYYQFLNIQPTLYENEKTYFYETKSQMEDAISQQSQKPVHIYLRIIVFVSITLWISVFLLSTSSSQHVSSKLDSIYEFSQLIFNYELLFHSWNNISLSLINYINQTDFLNLTCYDVINMIGTDYDSKNCKTISLLVKNVFQSCENVQDILATISSKYLFISSYSSLEQSLYQLLYPSITIINSQSVYDSTSYDSDVTTGLYYYTKELIQFLLSSNYSLTKDSTMYFKNQMYQFSTNLILMNDRIIDGYRLLSGFIDNETVELFPSFRSNTYLLYLIFWILSFFTIPLIRLFGVKEFTQIISKYFSLDEHPLENQNDQKVLHSNNIPEFIIDFSLPNIVYISITILIVFMGISTYLQYEQKQAFQNALLLSTAYLESGNNSMNSINALVNAFYIWQFSSMFSNYSLLDSKTDQLIISQWKMSHSISPLSVNPYEYTEIPEPLKMLCNKTESNHIHDYYKCWPIQHRVLLMSLYLKEMLTNQSYCLSHPFYIHIEHIFLSHIVDEMDSVSQSIVSEILTSSALGRFYSNLQFFLASLFIAISISYFVRVYVDKIYSYYVQFSRVLCSIDIDQITLNPKLSSYLLEQNESYSVALSKPNFFSLINELDHTVILLNSNFIILIGTKNINTIFDYEIENLVGQHISILIPHKGTNREDNEIRFYEMMTMIKNRSISSQFSRSIHCLNSNGEVLLMNINAKSQYYYDQIYFILEMFPDTERRLLESNLSSTQNVYQQLRKRLLPLNLMTNSISEHYYERKSFISGILIYVSLVSEDSNHEEFIKFIMPYLSGGNYSIVFDISMTHCYMLIVDVGNHEHIQKAIELFLEVMKIDHKTCHGCLLEIQNPEVVSIRPLTLGDEDTSSDIPINLIKRIKPSLTFNLVHPITHKIPDYIQFSMNDRFIVSKNITISCIHIDNVKFDNISDTDDLYYLYLKSHTNE